MSALFYTSTFAITYGFAQNILFLIQEFSFLRARSVRAPMLLTCFGLLRTFSGSTMW